jgi:DNA-binding MarR family transcriptional regulator
MSAHRDEVDRLIADWKRERPDLDISPFAVLSRISRISRNLDLETSGFDVLAALRRSGDPYQLSPGALMQETLVTSGTMTNRLDRLEELKLITRQPDPDDGRGSLVTLTASGMRAVDKALEGLLEQERELLKGLTREQKVALADLLSALAAHLEEN